MALRRLAQTNNAATATSSPRPSSSISSPASPGVSPSTPLRSGGAGPSTPRTRLVYPISPVTSPSLSASTPFDWAAARSRRPPPYATPVGKRVRGLRTSDVGTLGFASPGLGTPGARKRERVVRKKGFLERITSLPSRIAFELSLFPHNVPRPAPATSAWLLGGTAHFLHLCVRVAQIRKVPDSDLGWEDMYREGEDQPWFDWTVPTSMILIAASILNALYLFTRTRMYHLTLATEPVSSPHAAFVSRPRMVHMPSDDDMPKQQRIYVGPLLVSSLSHLWRAFVVSFCFLLNLSPPKRREKAAGKDEMERVQQLEVWTPGALESALFAVYSPAHAFLWMAVTSANWMLIGCIMFVIGVQLRALTRAYEALLKDRAIIAAEVLHEYDEKFVYPRVNPIRKDAAVMTHQAELVDSWDEE
ncbi:hypothetical protein AcV5_006325 [Taiwanofungus camphoratus]|nr:hypothetical protein AcV5_006325 [Antrodia cinnamomea]